MTGQTVEVVRPYRRKEDQTYWDISLPDGTRAFLPDTWTGPGETNGSFQPTELDALALLQLARIVGELQAQTCQKGEPRDDQRVALLESVFGREPATSDCPPCGSQPEATSQSSGGQP